MACENDVHFPVTEQIFLGAEKVDWMKIKYSDEHVLGSDRNLEITMSSRKELQGIDRCLSNMASETDAISTEEKEKMVRDYLILEWRYFLSEFGCGKFLAIQPPHFFDIEEDDARIVITPSGLRAFGDHATRYAEVDDDVGEGLNYGYNFLWRSGVGASFGVTSPKEKYKKWNSNTDVIDLMGVQSTNADKSEALGQYLVLGQVLSVQERRFIYNLLSGVGQKYNVDELLNLPRNGLILAVTTDMLDGFDGSQEQEYLHLVRKPSLFIDQSPLIDGDWYVFITKLDKLFRTRFGRRLFEDADIEMYPLINQIVEQYTPVLVDTLWNNRDEPSYYHWLRVMVMHCQAVWKDLNGRKLGLDRVERVARVFEHLGAIQDGLIIAGFEIGFDSPFDLNNGLELNVKDPWGYEDMDGKYCRKHKRRYHGSNCPDCQKSGQSSD